MQLYFCAIAAAPNTSLSNFCLVSFRLVFLGDGKTGFSLELTWLRDHPQKYDLGECEFHLAMTAENMEAAHALHEKMGCICYENPAMGVYFISDPDGYWIEMVPAK